MRDKDLLGVIYDILAQNEVTEGERAEVLRRIDSIDYDDLTINFDHDGENVHMQLKLERSK